MPVGVSLVANSSPVPAGPPLVLRDQHVLLGVGVVDDAHAADPGPRIDVRAEAGGGQDVVLVLPGDEIRRRVAGDRGEAGVAVLLGVGGVADGAVVLHAVPVVRAVEGEDAAPLRVDRRARRCPSRRCRCESARRCWRSRRSRACRRSPAPPVPGVPPVADATAGSRAPAWPAAPPLPLAPARPPPAPPLALPLPPVAPLPLRRRRRCRRWRSRHRFPSRHPSRSRHRSRVIRPSRWFRRTRRLHRFARPCPRSSWSRSPRNRPTGAPRRSRGAQPIGAGEAGRCHG